MSRCIAVLFVCLSFPALAADEQALLIIKGRITAPSGKIPADANVYVSPIHASTAFDVKPSGTFELKAVAARAYTVTLSAAGFAQTTKEVSVDALGRGDVGTLTLSPLKRATLTVALGHHASIKTAERQQFELTPEACAVVRSTDDSDCRMQLCLTQNGEELRFHRWFGATLQNVGKVELAELLTSTPRRTTVIQSDPASMPLVVGESALLGFDDPYCRGALHVDAIR